MAHFNTFNSCTVTYSCEAANAASCFLWRRHLISTCVCVRGAYFEYEF